MKNKAELKRVVSRMLDVSNRECSACIQNIDTGVTAFARLHNAKISWGKLEMIIFVPGEITFQIPYAKIRDLKEYENKSVEFFLEGRALVSIRKDCKTRRRA